MEYSKNIKLNYLHMFLRSFNLTHGIWLLFLAFKGFSLFQIGLFETVFHVTSLAMEVPTGIVADLYGRKFSRALGIFSYLIYIALMIFSTNFILIIIAFIFCALSFTFESGSGEALIYDSLLIMKEEKQFMKINGRNEVVYQFASGFALLIGGYVAMISFNLSFEITAIFYGLALFAILLMKETPLLNKKEHKSLKEMLVDHYIKSTKVVFKNKRLLYLIIIGAMVAAPITVIFLYIQNYFSILGYSYSMIGIFLALHSLFAAIGGVFAYKLEKKYKERKILLFIPLFVVVSIWLMLFDNIIFIPFIILGFFDSVFYVVLMDYINKIIPSETRATALSFFSLTFSVVMILIFPLMGYLGDLYSLKVSLFSLAIIVTLFYLFLLQVIRQKHLETK